MIVMNIVAVIYERTNTAVYATVLCIWVPVQRLTAFRLLTGDLAGLKCRGCVIVIE